MEAAVDHLDVLEVFKGETDELKGGLASIERDDQRAVESVVAEDLKLLRVVVPSEGFLGTFHVEDVEE